MRILIHFMAALLLYYFEGIVGSIMIRVLQTSNKKLLRKRWGT